MKKETIIYPNSWHKVNYEIEDTLVNFEAFEITGLDEESPELSEFDNEPAITGFIKWDGCCEFDYSTHYCGIHNAEKFLSLMKEIYKYKGSLGGSFLEEPDVF